MFAAERKIAMEEEKTAEKDVTFSHILVQTMESGGRKNSWLAEKMGITHAGLLQKFKKNNWKPAEIQFIKTLLEMY